MRKKNAEDVTHNVLTLCLFRETYRVDKKGFAEHINNEFAIVSEALQWYNVTIKNNKERRYWFMSCSQAFFLCKHCGNMVGLIENNGGPLVCCGEPMSELVPNTVDAAKEKHVPQVTKTDNGISVQVGSVPHPMEEAHHISFIYVATENGGQRKCLKIGAEPKHDFTFIDDKPIAVYEYCNLHGLWKAEV